MLIRVKLRGGSRAAARSNMQCFVIIVKGFQPLTVITKHSILDVAAALDPPLRLVLIRVDWCGLVLVLVCVCVCVCVCVYGLTI